MKPEQNPIPNLVLHMSPLMILMLLHHILRKQETITNIRQESISVTKLLINSNNLSSPRYIRQQGWRRPGIDNLKGGGTESRLIRSVEAILRPRQPLQPSTWMITS